MLCNSELRSFQHHLPEFGTRGIRLVAISVDPAETSQRHRQRMGYTFPFLSDPKAEVIRRYDLLHPGAGPKRQDISRPAEFLLNTSGIIQWRNLTEDAAVRARPQQVLKTFDEQSGKTVR
ncbi:MAG: redoxin domain-containing protein [Chthoniobacterales bacterium]